MLLAFIAASHSIWRRLAPARGCPRWLALSEWFANIHASCHSWC